MTTTERLDELDTISKRGLALAKAKQRPTVSDLRVMRLAALAYRKLEARADTLTTAQINLLMEVGRNLKPAITKLASLDGIDGDALIEQATRGDSPLWSRWHALVLDVDATDSTNPPKGRTANDCVRGYCEAHPDFQRLVVAVHNEGDTPTLRRAFAELFTSTKIAKGLGGKVKGWTSDKVTNTAYFRNEVKPHLPERHSRRGRQ